jgi:DNA-binding FadR family transcriptional regulator
MVTRSEDYAFLRLLAAARSGEGDSLKTLAEIAGDLGISVSRVREQLEVAKALGLVDIRPRSGMRRREYSFTPAASQSLKYAMLLDPGSFEQFADLRNQLEAAYWEPAVRLLTAGDIAALQALMAQAWEKLRGQPVQIPHAEHRELHLSLYRRLQNPFVLGILEAFWEAYETVGLNLYADYAYLQEVWSYHQKMVDAIVQQDYTAGYRALLAHKDLLHFRAVQPNGIERINISP